MTHHTKHRRDSRLQAMHNAGYPQGVVVDPMPITAGDEVTVLYYGLLDRSGADQVYLHAGYGDAGNWHDISETGMEKTGWGWVKTMQITDDSRLHVCFRDSAYNWDNNNGMNWSFEIHNGKLR